MAGRRMIMKNTHRMDVGRKFFAALLIAAVVLAFSPLAATDVHAATLDEMEPNNNSVGASFDDNISFAKDVSLGNTYTGTFVDAKDDEWFKLTLPAATWVTIDVQRLATQGIATTQSFAYVVVYNSSGQSIDSEYVEGGDETINLVKELAAGTYYLKIQPGVSIPAGSVNTWAFSLIDKGLIEMVLGTDAIAMSEEPALSQIKKRIIVYSGDVKLPESEYDVIMTNATRAGDSTVTVTGKNSHYGTHTFNVLKYITPTYLSGSANFKKKTVTVKLTKVYGASGYIIKYKFPGKGWKTKKTTKTKYTFKKVKNLKNGKIFSFKVIAYSKSGGKTYYSRLSFSPKKYWSTATYKVIRY
jgi:hypothetical protein